MHKRYMHHAVSKIISFCEKGDFPKEENGFLVLSVKRQIEIINYKPNICLFYVANMQKISYNTTRGDILNPSKIYLVSLSEVWKPPFGNQ